jgi:hypothetical protein
MFNEDREENAMQRSNQLNCFPLEPNQPEATSPQNMTEKKIPPPAERKSSTRSKRQQRFLSFDP